MMNPDSGGTKYPQTFSTIWLAVWDLKHALVHMKGKGRRLFLGNIKEVVFRKNSKG